MQKPFCFCALRPRPLCTGFPPRIQVGEEHQLGRCRQGSSRSRPAAVPAGRGGRMGGTARQRSGCWVRVPGTAACGAAERLRRPGCRAGALYCEAGSKRPRCRSSARRAGWMADGSAARQVGRWGHAILPWCGEECRRHERRAGAAVAGEGVRGAGQWGNGTWSPVLHSYTIGREGLEQLGALRAFAVRQVR